MGSFLQSWNTNIYSTTLLCTGQGSIDLQAGEIFTLVLLMQVPEIFDSAINQIAELKVGGFGRGFGYRFQFDKVSRFSMVFADFGIANCVGWLSFNSHQTCKM